MMFRLEDLKMRLSRYALVSAVLLAACGGEKKQSTMDSAATNPTPTPSTASGTPSTPGQNAAPITGETHEVKMVQDAQGNYRFDPADITIKSGDGVKFVMVSGGPHNVAFDPAQIPANAKAQLSANMQQQVSELSSPMMMNPNETYTISFGQMPPGKYDYHCTPHLALGMRGTITVQ
jgi:plastocyanin